MRLVVTRPSLEADDWVTRLRANGVDAVKVPLQAVAAAADAAAVVAAWASLGARSLVVFVSPNAVRHFAAARPSGAPWPPAMRAAAPGPGTVDALVAAGVGRASIVAPPTEGRRFDSEALWDALGAAWHGADVLVVRGEGGREWLAERLRDAGATVSFVAAYRRVAPTFDAAATQALAAALGAPHSHAWLFSSSAAIETLERRAPDGAWRGSIAIATHPRIAARARDAGFADVRTPSARFDDVLAAVREVIASHP